MSTEQTTRTTRSSQERKKVWTPPKAFSAPAVPEGYKARWVRRKFKTADDDDNVISRKEQGYEVVRPEQLAPGAIEPRTVEEGRHQGVVSSGDLILMMVPEEIANQRNEYYGSQADKMQKAVDQELDKEEDNKMPLQRINKTKVKTGRDSFQA